MAASMHFFEKSGSIKWRTLQFPRRRDRVDGDDASVGASYLELAEVLMEHGSQTNADLRELWSRIVDLELAREVAGYFRINRADAESIIDNFKEVVSQWPALAGALGLSKREQDNMAPAFRLAEPMQ